MNNLMNLSQGESIYLGNNLGQGELAELLQKVDQLLLNINSGGSGQTAVELTPIADSTPEKIVKPTLRKAGRKKLTTEAIARNQVKTSIIKRENALAIEVRVAEKARKAQIKAERAARKTKALNEAAAERERMQQLANKRMQQKAEAALPVTIPEGALIVSGLLAIPGKTGVRVDSKTVIYVKHGHDIQQAIETYLAKRRIASII